MKFKRIELENMFAYEGAVPFDLEKTDEDRNIALVWGRNGMGKTSFLRSLKLLFLGIDSPGVRSVGTPPRQLGLRQFAVGDGANWSGLINRHAVQRAEAEGRTVTARVRAEWTMEDGGTITAERSWTPTPTTVNESVIVYDGGERLVGEPAADRIGDLLPPEFVDFFFFDGEQIKELAENDDRKEIDFDRLLRVTFLKELGDELGKISSERGRRDMSVELLQSITLKDTALAKARGARDLARQQLATAEETIVETLETLRRLQRTRESLSAGASDAQRATFEKRRTDVRGLIEDQLATIAEKLPPTAPVLANLGLVHAALEAVEHKIESSSTAERIYLDRVTPQLARWLGDSPAPLDAETAASVAEKLVDRMSKELPAAGSGGLFASLSPARAETLRDSLLRYAVGGEDQLRAQVAQLDALRRLQHELTELDEAIMRLEVGSQADLEQYREVTLAIANAEETLANAQQTKGLQNDRLSAANRDIKALGQEIATLQESHERAGRDRAEAQYIEKVRGALVDLRDALRQTMRERLENAINARFADLVHDHNLIDKIAIDDRYTLSFRDAQGHLIGRASLSSGLKQLAATALMWAMKEVSDFQMPVVIDTPLGRIDLENQENMLRNYYPNLAHQVIILPTNAEIDKAKFPWIADHVGVQYRIVNETGDRARVELGSLLKN